MVVFPGMLFYGINIIILPDGHRTKLSTCCCRLEMTRMPIHMHDLRPLRTVELTPPDYKINAQHLIDSCIEMEVKVWCVFTHNSIYAVVQICHRPSVHLSVCLFVTRVDQSKTVEVRIKQFSPYSSPIPLVFTGQVSSRNSDGIAPSVGLKQWWGGKNKLFCSVMRKYLENGARRRKLLLMTNSKLLMSF